MTGLVKKIDQRLDEAAAKQSQGRHLGVFIIFDSDAKGLDQQLRNLAEKEGLKRVSLCLGSPPAAYEVSKEAAVTAVIYDRGMVAANFALRKGPLAEAKRDAIVEALAKVLPK